MVDWHTQKAVLAERVAARNQHAKGKRVAVEDLPAFLGAVPLMIGTGVGAELRQPLSHGKQTNAATRSPTWRLIRFHDQSYYEISLL